MAGYAVFETAIGPCGIAWRDGRLLATMLPEVSEKALRQRLRERLPELEEATPPAFVESAMARIRALLAGTGADDNLADLPLALDDLAPFQRRIYELARALAPGDTVTYGELAARAGSPGAARAVGQAMARNPFGIVVPCHRVVAAGGRSGGFSASGGVGTKLRMLAIERAAREPREEASPPPFDLALAERHLQRADRTLARGMRAVGPCGLRVSAAPDVFAMLAQSIIYQQLSGKAAGTIFGRFCALLGPDVRWPTARQVLALDEHRLRGAGLSRAKALAVLDLAVKVEQGELPPLSDLQALPDEAVIEHLTRVRGIGRWTAEMFLLFRLGRPDVLPLDDLGVRKGFQRLFRLEALPERETLAARAERWRPWRSVATWYLWAVLEVA